MNLYTSEVELSSYETAEAGENWENVGEISDIIHSHDGEVMAVLLDIGGFPGIGEHTVAVNMRDLKLVSDSDDQGNLFIVVNAGKTQIEDAPEYDTAIIGNWYESDGAEAGRAVGYASDGMENAEKTQDELRPAANMAQDTAEEAAEAAGKEAEAEAQAAEDTAKAAEDAAVQAEAESQTEEEAFAMVDAA